MKQASLFTGPKRGDRSAAILSATSQHEGINRAIASTILANPESYIPGLVEWAELVATYNGYKSETRLENRQ